MVLGGVLESGQVIIIPDHIKYYVELTYEDALRGLTYMGCAVLGKDVVEAIKITEKHFGVSTLVKNCIKQGPASVSMVYDVHRLF